MRENRRGNYNRVNWHAYRLVRDEAKYGICNNAQRLNGPNDAGLDFIPEKMVILGTNIPGHKVDEEDDDE